VELSLPTQIIGDFYRLSEGLRQVPHNRLISKLVSYGIDQALVNRATEKLKAHASSTKSQQLRALKFLFYTLCK